MYIIGWYNELLFMSQLVRYGLVGLAINLLLYCGYLLVTYMGLEPKISMSLIYITGVVIGFFGHRQWTFSHGGKVSHAMWRYALAHFLGYSINFLLLLGLVDYLAYPHELVQGAAILIVAAFLFVVFKYWVFTGNNVHAVN
ncbi:MAG TPA: GtrA family protein [Aestuariivirga sp.]|nr:GtrA family protein [Aestuariivirga sp.]